MTNRAQQLLEQIVAICHKINAYPTYAQLMDYNIHKDHIRHHFGNRTRLYQIIGKKYPKLAKKLNKMSQSTSRISQTEKTQSLQSIYKLLGVMNEKKTRKNTIYSR